MSLSPEVEQSMRNPVWHSLTTNHAHVAIGEGLARRYPVEIHQATGLAEYSESALHDLAKIVDKGEDVYLAGFEPPEEMPGWNVHWRYTTTQLIQDQPVAEVETTETILTMTAADVPEIFQLVELTQPGPFFPRIIEIGHYIGIRKEGQLVALAGERFNPLGCHEICTVCTHPDYQRHGYASALVSRLAADDWKRGEVPFIHAGREEEDVRRLYQRLGFRDHFDFVWVYLNH